MISVKFRNQTESQPAEFTQLISDQTLRPELEEAARQENSPTSDIEVSEDDRAQAVDALRRIEEKQQAHARRITIRSRIAGFSRTTKVLVGIGLTGIIVALGVSTISPIAAFAHEKLVQVRLIDPASGMDLESFRSLVVQVFGATGLFFGAVPIIAHFFKKK